MAVATVHWMRFILDHRNTGGTFIIYPTITKIQCLRHFLSIPCDRFADTKATGKNEALRATDRQYSSVVAPRFG